MSTATARHGLTPLLPLLLVAAWYVLTLRANPHGRVPVPPQVLSSAGELVGSGSLPSALAVSLARVLSGFAIATLIGVCLGVAMGYRRLVDEVVDPLIETLRPVAPIALVPMAILWFGTSNQAAISIVTYAAFFPTVLNALAGVRGLDPNLIRAARTMGASEWTIFSHVILPGALPSLVVGARLAMGAAWTSVVAAELAVGAKSGSGSSGGIGQLMFNFYLYEPDPNPIVVCMIAVGVVGVVLFFVMEGAARLLMPWRAHH